MDGFVGAIGRGIMGLVEGALSTIGLVLGALVRNVDSVLPGGWLAVLAFAAVLAGFWVLARR